MPHREVNETRALYLTGQRASQAVQADPFLLQAQREMQAACPGIVSIEAEEAQGVFVLVISLREPTLDDMDRLCDLQWDLMDRYPERTLHIKIRDADCSL
jgi:hypothetical protein